MVDLDERSVGVSMGVTDRNLTIEYKNEGKELIDVVYSQSSESCGAEALASSSQLRTSIFKPFPLLAKMSNVIDPEKFMTKLLDLLKRAKTVAQEPKTVQCFEKIELELQKMKEKDLIAKVKLFDQTMFWQFTSLERRLGNFILEADTTYSDVAEVNKALDLMFDDINQIKGSIPLVEQMPTRESSQESGVRRTNPNQLGLAPKMSQKWLQLGLEDRILQSPAMVNIRRTYEDLESLELKMCCLSFSIFPDDSVMKKRPLIYWWIGEGFIKSKSTQQKTTEDVGEEIFNTLMRKELIYNEIYSNVSSRKVFVNSCKMHPWIRRMLISLVSEARLFHFDSEFPRMPSYELSNCRRACLVFDHLIPKGDGLENLLTVFNVTEHYLDLKKEWINKLKKVVVLQLGRWQDSAKHHIEVEDEGFIAQEDGGFLKGLGAPNKHLKYLSLRGISRINRLPSSVLSLVSLEILDLRACHNLERMPSDISSLRKLTHLDLSECYLLESMPKGIEKLSALQVLKGFVIGSLRNTPCKLGDLAKLQYLKRLSIHLGNEAVVQEGEFKKLRDIISLRRLKISWGVSEKLIAKRATIAKKSLEFLLPPHLEKLDLQGIPLKNVPEWLKPSQVKNLKKLYIRGGELASLAHGDPEGWAVEFLRLKYLKELKLESPSLQEAFPCLQRLDFLTVMTEK